MDDMREKSERDIMPKLGASFSRSRGGKVLFTFVSDPSSIVGPRRATEADKAAYPGEFAAFIADHPGPDKVDHDESGSPEPAPPPPTARRKPKT